MDLDFLDSPIAYHRIFVVLLGDHASAAFLSQCIYWSKRTKNVNGWFYKSLQDWYDEIVITRTQLKRVADNLERLGLIQRKKARIHGVIEYRICGDALRKWVSGEGQQLTAQQIVSRFSFRLVKLGATAHSRAFNSDGGEYIDFRELVLGRQTNELVICACCGNPIYRGPSMHSQTKSTPDSLAFSYVTPLENGGQHTAENIAIVHFGCIPAMQAPILDSIKNTLINQDFADNQQSNIKHDEIDPESGKTLINQDFADNQQRAMLIISKEQCCKSAKTYTEITNIRERESGARDLGDESVAAAIQASQQESETAKRNEALAAINSQTTIAPLAQTVQDSPTLHQLMGTSPDPQAKPSLDSAQIAMGQIARKAGLRCSASDSRFGELISEGITIAEFRDAILRADKAKGPGGYTLAYVLTIVRNLHRELQYHGGQAEISSNDIANTSPKQPRSGARNPAARRVAPARSADDILKEAPTDEDGNHVFRC